MWVVHVVKEKKWIHCYENVKGVIYVADVASYNQCLYEDNSTNRLIEDLDLFAKVCESDWIRNLPVFLLLNKFDLFIDKIQKHHLNEIFSDYPEYICNTTANASLEFSSKFILNKFLLRNSTGLRVYPFFTNCTDTNNMKLILNVLKEKIKNNGISMEAIHETSSH